MSIGMQKPLSAWDHLDTHKYREEGRTVGTLLSERVFSSAERAKVGLKAEALVLAVRGQRDHGGVVEAFLREFSLGTREGLALMYLAEALLRIPDQDTRDKLIAEKIGGADWKGHLWGSRSFLVNASTAGLALSSRLLEADPVASARAANVIQRVARRIGEPLIRQAIGAAIRIMGDQFVLGRTIEEGLARAKKELLLCSFDMLGEGARTELDADRYEAAYARAIETVGANKEGVGPECGHGVSVKLSALSPRYEATQEDQVWSDLYPRLKRLALIAAKYDLNFTLDAEEADRLVLSLKLLDRLAREPDLGPWEGLGIAVQAYQTRCSQVVAAVVELARSSGRRLMVRLVKGAYWDGEIKRAQVAGRSGYPVFTTKSATDLSYLVCAKALIAAAPAVYSQFATHNAHTLAAVHLLAEKAGVAIEFQRLHGMGEGLYRAASKQLDGLSVRAYAPVGGHEDLLPYLVRRLLENGANSSFVYTLTDDKVPASSVAHDPISAVESHPGPNDKIPVPRDIYGPNRVNSLGRDYSQAAERVSIARFVQSIDCSVLRAGAIVDGELRVGADEQPVMSPSDRSKVLGASTEATSGDVDDAIRLAQIAQPAWDRAGGAHRAELLRSVGAAIERDMDRLVALLARESGKTLNDGVAEVREAVDFCRYYADLAARQFGAPEILPGPVGEHNQLVLRGRGVFACISPWNFPLAIFVGQIAAALAAGNAAMAKPAEQTPLVAAEAVRHFHAAGLDPRLLALLPGRGDTVGEHLVAHEGIDGVAFTGGTDTARRINQLLAARAGPIIPLIAETGGVNGMFVDSSALREQVVDDVLLSAFGSAGQRCSALRILYVPTDIADDMLKAIAGAMEMLKVGDPANPSTDVGPVIDEAARDALNEHIGRLGREAKIIKQIEPDPSLERGVFFGPVLVEIPSPDFLEREVFGPVLHVYRYAPPDLPIVARALAALRFGLTLGVHSRLDGFVAEVSALVPAGNVYVNRSVIGAVVGVQPFGGLGLSGTGPKAGGPQALSRYSTEQAVSVNTTAQGGNPSLLNI